MLGNMKHGKHNENMKYLRTYICVIKLKENKSDKYKNQGNDYIEIRRRTKLRSGTMGSFKY